MFESPLEYVLAAATALGLPWAHWRAFRDPDRRLLTAVLLLDLAFGALVALGAFDHRTFERLAQEDGFIEWATVVAWLGAALSFARLLRGRSRLTQLALLGVSLFCVFVAGEEISWGQRLFAFQPPEMFLDLNFQQELNVHNLLMDDRWLGFELSSKHLVAAIAVLYGVVLPGLARLVRSFAPAAPPFVLWPWFVAVALAEIVYPVELTGEAAELALGLLFLAAACMPLALRALPIAFAATAAGALLISLLVGRVLYGDDADTVAATRAELDRLAADMRAPGALQSELWDRSSIHKRMFTAVRSGYVRFEPGASAFLEGRGTPADTESGEPRRDRLGYFLDPWQNPYWVAFSNRDARLSLYSFGPNRQRDSDPKAGSAGGDDVMVTFAASADQP